ncbi:succinyl-diaminopimelate desuccinylase [Legionella lansingensis]|uniref:Succinyl-diaminopimelate desuccinylase n=1 Tax=Legionella lansingensis TaxID=45067 RepID=A0A0W0VP82_9GAMM|nr:M20 family metallopeptidase [Legionella lansingensis]KTD21984.1 succinyl-diaminopimelate desuccinylase [Legionella lansingensis]SNV51613.1 succinyl-diaminopimelate desuccinylase [Legionella lansingensis]
MLNSQKLYEYVAQQWQDNILPSLCEYIKIPNKSPHFDAQWQEHGHMERAVSHVAEWCRNHAPAGMTLEIARLPGRTPLLLMEVPGESKETVLLYGHLDKQPEMSGWHESLGPWKPVIKDGRLYGRGSADDGYATYASLTAINALRAQGLPHARCVLLIEACEESGSHDLPFYIDTLKEKIGEPSLVICLDSGAGNYDQLWMTTSLRGNVTGELTVDVLTEGVHSGYASGIVADSFRIAKQLISRIEDETTGEIKLEALYCDIPEDRVRQAAACAEILGNEVYSNIPFHSGVEPVTHNRRELILNRSWRPALAVTGAMGLPATADAGNVLRPKTSLKLSMRLPPLVLPQKALAAMQEALTSNPPYNAKVAFHVHDGAVGWNAPKMVEWLEKAINDASLTFYQKPAAYIGEGGTIPFMGMLGEKFPKAQFMITGVLGPHSNAHGPNEFLHLEMAKKLTACVAFVLNSHYHQTTLDR